MHFVKLIKLVKNGLSMVSYKTIKMNNERCSIFKKKNWSVNSDPVHQNHKQADGMVHIYIKPLLNWVFPHCFYTFVHLVSVSNQVDAHFS